MELREWDLLGFSETELLSINRIRDFANWENVALSSSSFNDELKERITSFFTRAHLNYQNTFFLNASLRRDASAILGENNNAAFFPAVSAAVDFSNFFNGDSSDLLKARLGYGVTGGRPFSMEIAEMNADLGTERHKEINLGLDFKASILSGQLEVYRRNSSDLIIQNFFGDAVLGETDKYFNQGELITTGLEFSLALDVINTKKGHFKTGTVFSTYNTMVEDIAFDNLVFGDLGSPGQNGTNMIRVKKGEEFGQIWGPVFAGVDVQGLPLFEDVNGDGQLIVNPGQSLAEEVDFEVLGNSIPDYEVAAWQELRIGQWKLKAFFRGAFGHSLVNTFRVFHEPLQPTLTAYNNTNTGLGVEGLTFARYSSLYVEKADFVKLAYLTLSKTFRFKENAFFNKLEIGISGQNLFTWTKYTGTDPEPSFFDTTEEYSTLSPGIDRRTHYFPSRTILFSLNCSF